jgi:hypothetical protein
LKTDVVKHEQKAALKECIRENVDKLAFADNKLFMQLVNELQGVVANAILLCRLHNLPEEYPSVVVTLNTFCNTLTPSQVALFTTIDKAPSLDISYHNFVKRASVGDIYCKPTVARLSQRALVVAATTSSDKNPQPMEVLNVEEGQTTKHTWLTPRRMQLFV